MSKGERTRTRATGVALEMATTMGIDGVTIGGVAERSGLSKSGLFAHYRSRTALQLAVLEQASLTASAVVFDGLDEVAPGVERLRVLFGRWIGWTTTAGLPGGCPFAAAVFELDDARDPDDEVRAVVDETRRELTRTLEGLVTEAVDAGELRSDTDPAQITWEIEAVYLGHHVSSRFDRNGDADHRALRAFDSIIDRHRPGRPR